MAECGFCDQEMADAVSCTTAVLHVDGGEIPMIPVDPERDCHDCRAPAGGLHHPGCDSQRCPLCEGQMCSCGCVFDEDPAQCDYRWPSDGKCEGEHNCGLWEDHAEAHRCEWCFTPCIVTGEP